MLFTAIVRYLISSVLIVGAACAAPAGGTQAPALSPVADQPGQSATAARSATGSDRGGETAGASKGGEGTLVQGSPTASHLNPSEATQAEMTSGRRFDARLTGFAYPFPVKTFAVQHRGQPLAMRYMDVEPSKEAAAQVAHGVVVLLHGKNFVAASWEQTIRALSEQGYRVIAPDQIGFGKSDKPADYPFTFQALAENTRALLAALGIEQSAVVGHSMGGMLAVRYALMFPEQTSRLVLVNPIGLEDWKTVVPHRSVELSYQEELAQTPQTLRAYQEKSYYAGVWKPEYDKYLEPLAGFTSDPDYPKVAWCSALTQEMIFTQPVLYEFPRLKVPTLLIIGQRDRTAIGKARAPAAVAEKLGDYPKLGRAAARAIPGAKLVELDGIGHLPQVEAFPKFIAAVQGFLKKAS